MEKARIEEAARAAARAFHYLRKQGYAEGRAAQLVSAAIEFYPRELATLYGANTQGEE